MGTRALGKAAWTWAVALGLVAGCAHSGGTAPVVSATGLVLHTQSHFIRAEVTETGIQGPQFNIARTVDALRGSVFNRPVNLAISPARDEVSGILGTSPLKIQSRHEGAALHTTGLLGGYLSDFVSSAAAIKGRIGPCSYDLRFAGGAYVGFRSCRDRGVEEATLSIPPTFAGWKDAEMAAGLGLFLIAPSANRSIAFETLRPRPMPLNSTATRGPRPPMH